MKLKFIQNTSPRNADNPGYRWTVKGSCTDEILKQIDDYRSQISWSDSKEYSGGVILIPRSGIGIVFRRFRSSLLDCKNRSKFTVNGLEFFLRDARTMGINGIWDLPCLSDDAEENLTPEYDFTSAPDDYPPEFAELKAALTAEKNCFFLLEKDNGKFSLSRIDIPWETTDKAFKKKSPDKKSCFQYREGGNDFDEEKKGNSFMRKVFVVILSILTILGAGGTVKFYSELADCKRALADSEKKLNSAEKELKDRDAEISRLNKEIDIQRAPEDVDKALSKINNKISKIKEELKELENLSEKLPELRNNLDKFKEKNKSTIF